jgi:exodeoxyribonuclease V gamma subunit
VRDRITTKHPLQPFDPRNFLPRQLKTDGAFSFDPIGYDAAVAAAGPRSPRPCAAAGPAALPPTRRTSRSSTCSGCSSTRPAASCASAWTSRSPVLRRTRRSPCPSSWTTSSATPSRSACCRTGCAGWTSTSHGAARSGAVRCRRDSSARRASRPPRSVPSWCSRLGAGARAGAESYDIDLALPDGSRLLGTVTAVRGTVLLSTTCASLAARHRLHAWVQLVALSVATRTSAGPPWPSARAARRSSAACRGRSTGGGTGRARAAGDRYRTGLTCPLPLPVKTSLEYANAATGV